MRTHIQTMRITPEELREAEEFLRLNPSFSSLSTLARVATFDFIRTKTSISLIPTTPRAEPSRLPFLWDYDLSRSQVLEILRHRPIEEKKWLIARILEHAKLGEVMEYLSLEEIARALPHLKMKSKIKAHWEKAISLWTQTPKKSSQRHK